MDRLDENVKEEADGIHNSLGNNQMQHRKSHDSSFLAIVENMTEFRPTLCVDACKQGLLTCLLKRLKVRNRRQNEIFFLVLLDQISIRFYSFVLLRINVNFITKS
jgi:hypothetical protein